MRLAERMETIRREGRKAFVAYLTAGDPHLSATATFVKGMSEAGADVIELGVPHSDPVADGPTNRHSSDRALRSGTTLGGILGMVTRLRAEGVTVPLVLFTYYNPLLRFGLSRFTAEAKKAGIDGVLVVDLPPEEAECWARLLGTAGLASIFLASPTTSPERLRRVAALSTGFVYYVSRTGVTGAQKALSETLDAELATVRSRVASPLVVGFGISTPEQVAIVAPRADGVVVGSRIVDEIANFGEGADLVALVRHLRSGLNGREEETC